MIFQSIKMAWNSIASNKMCSFLTMLGGIAVISLVVGGIGILKVAGMFVSDMSFSISPQVTALAVGFSAFSVLSSVFIRRGKPPENIRSTHCVILVDQTGKTLYNKITKGFVVK